jgi:hypothetical protein
MIEQRLLKVGCVRVPSANIAAVQLKHFEAEIALEVWILDLDLFSGTPDAFFSNFG